MDETLNGFDTFSKVQIFSNEETNINTSYLLCDHSLTDLPKKYWKSTFRIMLILIISSIFVPSPTENFKNVHYFDSKNYPNYTILASVTNLPKYSLNGIYLSLQFVDFAMYKYISTNTQSTSTPTAYSDERLQNNHFLINGNLKMKFGNKQNDQLISVINSEPDINVNFEHSFYVTNFLISRSSNPFIFFSDKFPTYSSLALNLTLNALHPRADKLIFSFRISSLLYESFEFFLQLTLLWLLISDTSFIWLFKQMISYKHHERSIDLNIQQRLTFVLEIFTLLSLIVPLFSGSVSYLSLNSVFPFMINIHIIIRDGLYTYILFYIVSLFVLASQNPSNYTNLNQQEKQSEIIDQPEKVVVVECSNDPSSSLVFPFLFITPFFVCHILNDIDIFGPSNSYINSNIVTIAPPFCYRHLTLLSFNFIHLISYFVFIVFLWFLYRKIKKYESKFNRLSNRKDKFYSSLKNKITNYSIFVVPLIIIVSLPLAREIISLLASQKTHFVPADNSQGVNITRNEFTFSAARLHNEYIGSRRSLIISYIYQLLYPLFYEPKTALFSTIFLSSVPLFTIAMSALHAPISLFSE